VPVYAGAGRSTMMKLAKECPWPNCPNQKLADEVRNATKMANELGMDGIEDDINNKKIVERLKKRIEELKDYSMEPDYTIHAELQEILEGKE